MRTRDILRLVHLGSSVAEHDDALEQYFIETETFAALVADRADTIAGDKGTGKTAVYRILQKRYATMAALTRVEVIPGFNPAGSPVFQRLAEGQVLEEGQYISIWKAYVLSLVGNWALKVNEGALSENMIELEALLKRGGLHSASDEPGPVFSQIANLVRRLTRPSSMEVAATISPEGWPVVAPRVEFGDETSAPSIIEHDSALRLLDTVLDETGFATWVVLDRLDEAFQGFPTAEVPALRALLRTYLDLAEFTNLHLKLFIRKDLFRRIIEDRFVNLTHVNARKMEITWDEDDLFDLLCRRVRENADFLQAVGAESVVTNHELFALLFPVQVDPGSRRPTTWNWMLSRIRDGNDIAPPRNLIDLVTKALEAQLRREGREETEWEPGTPLVEADAIKRGFAALSAERVEDTLLAEAGEYAPLIERFRDGRAEHNEESLAVVLGVSADSVRPSVKPLAELGFLQQIGDTWKIPMLYRGGLEITQGKAFDTGAPSEEEDELD